MKDNKFIIQKLILLIFPFLITFTLYVLFNGETSPGGGFAAGVLLSTSFIMLDLAFTNLRLPLIVLNIISVIFISLYFLIALFGIMYTNRGLDYNFLQIFGFDSILSQKIGILLVEICITLVISTSTNAIYLAFKDFGLGEEKSH